MNNFDPANAGLNKETGEERTARRVEELVEWQELLDAARHQSVAVVLQGRGAREKQVIDEYLRGRREA